jgi:hypothetical protein
MGYLRSYPDIQRFNTVLDNVDFWIGKRYERVTSAYSKRIWQTTICLLTLHIDLILVSSNRINVKENI